MTSQASASHRTSLTGGKSAGLVPWANAVARADKSRRKRDLHGRTQAGLPRPRGRYVYAWFNDSSPLPFYVGKGSASRAWDRHEDDHGRAMWCQTIRASCAGFRVEIVRDNLTDEGAFLLESSLMSFVAMLGGTLSNQASGMLRKERPPLELETLPCVASLDAPDAPETTIGPLDRSGLPRDPNSPQKRS